MTCMYDRDEECCGNCPRCPRAIKAEPDPDYLRDEMIDWEKEENE